jgi:hypothetical protein
MKIFAVTSPPSEDTYIVLTGGALAACGAVFILAAGLWLYYLPRTWRYLFGAWKKKEIQFWKKYVADTPETSPVRFYSAMLLCVWLLSVQTLIGLALLWIGIGTFFKAILA